MRIEVSLSAVLLVFPQVGCRERASPDDAKCVEGFRHLIRVPDVRADLEAGGGASWLAPDSTLERRFVERCRNLRPEAVACLSSITDLKSFDRCEGTKVLAPAFKSLLPPERQAQIAREQGDAETHALVKAIAMRATGEAGFDPVPASFTLPESTPLTPPKACCAYEGGECPVDAKEWTHPTWLKFEFRPSQPFRFQYRFTSEGKGTQARFVVQAVGDPTCAGQLETWEINGSVHDGRLERDEWNAVRGR